MFSCCFCQKTKKITRKRKSSFIKYKSFASLKKPIVRQTPIFAGEINN